MPRYDYRCGACRRVMEVTHSMYTTPRVQCACGTPMRRLLPSFATPKDKRYEFTTQHWLPGTRISSKAQWQRLLKRHHMTDDISPQEQTRRMQSNLNAKHQLEHRKAFGQQMRQTLRRTLRETPVNRNGTQWKTLHRLITREGR